MRCLVVLACVCAVAYARAQSSVDTLELKTNAEIPEPEPIEEPITDIKSSSSPNQDIQSDEANIKTNENESNISSNDEELDIAPTNSAPSVIVPKPDESKNGANQDIQSDEANIKTNENESNIGSNYEELYIAPTNSAPSVIVPKPDESKNSANQDIQSDEVNIKTNENESNISSNDEELDVAPTNLVPSVIVPKPDESSGNDEDLDIAPTNLAPIIVADIDESSDSVNDEDLEVSPTNLAPSVSDRQGRYKSLPDQYNEESAPRSAGKLICKEKNERYSVPGSCDKYVECLNGTAEEKQCPDGLRYNPNVLFNVYPCQYPSDVPCLGRSALQPAQPTADCPHQFGYFKTGDTRNCSGFRNCVNGVGYDFTCPDGLAFSTEYYRCEWPDQVSEQDCDAEAFLGFRCPEVPTTKELGPPAGFRFYRSPSDCQVYFICIDGKPRRLACGGYSAFDELSETCVNAEEVSVCPQELKTRAAQAKEKEERRQRLLAENPLKSGKSRYTAEEFPTNVPTYAEPEPTQNFAEEGDVENLVPKFPTNVPTYAAPKPTRNLAEEEDVENVIPTLLSELEE